MRHLSFVIASLFLLSPSLIAAAPPTTQCGHPFHAPCHEHVPRPWRRISDAIIRKIWGLPEKQHASPGQSGDVPVGGGAPSGKLLARYGQDIVMRFTIRTAEEASALAEAADVLFLDVWEFSDNWVDIRIAKDVVSEARVTALQPTTTDIMLTGTVSAWTSSFLPSEIARCPDA
jgi:extracellular matrix protein 14